MPCPSSALPVKTVISPSGIDPDPGVEETVVVETARQFRRLGGTTRRRFLRNAAARQREGDDQRAVPFSRLRRLMPLGSKAFITALPSGSTAAAHQLPGAPDGARMRICVPQRQRLIRQRLPYLGLRGRGVLLQQGLGGHHHAGNAVSALRRLHLDEGRCIGPGSSIVPSPSTVVISLP